MTEAHATLPLGQAHPGPHETTRERHRSAHRQLAAVVAVWAMVAAALGLLVDGVYGPDEATVAMLRGFDAVTLAVIAPALLLAVRFGRHGSTLEGLLTSSLLAYLGYTYTYNLLGAGFTDLMLLQAPLFTATLVALVLTLRDLPIVGLSDRLAWGDTRIAAGVLGLLAVSLGAMWVYACVVVHLGIVLNLTLPIPLYSAAAVLLWRRRAWGFGLAVLALVAGTLHQISYVVALLFQYAADAPGSVPVDPVEPTVLMLFGVAAVLLLRRPGAVRPGDQGW